MGNVLKFCKKDSQLLVAAKRGDTEAVRRLLRSSANVDTLDKEHNTPLHYASQYGHIDIVNLLLSKNPNVDPIDDFGQTSLHLVVMHGRAGVENLIYNGANVDACNKGRMTALHLASLNGHISIVEILLNNYATVDVTTQSDETPFYLAAKNGHAEVTDLLLSRGVSDFVLTGRNKETPLHAAVNNGHTEVAEVILKHCARISGNLINCQHRLQKNAFDLIIETSSIQPIQLLRSDGRRLSAGIVWSEENKPLEIREDKHGHTALDIAVKSAQPKMVKLLLNADQGLYSEEHLRKSFHYLILARVSDCRKDNEFATDLSDAEKYEIFSENIKEIAQTLISSSKFNVNYKNTFGQTLIYDVITEMRCFRRNLPGKNIHMIYFIKLLLESAAEINLKNSYGETPLMIASKYGCCDAIQILFDWEQKSGMKLDLDARDQHGATALMKAVANEECFHDIYFQRDCVLNSGARDRYRSTPLIKAVEKNHVSVIRLLLDHKASVNLCDYFGFTALHTAIYERKTSWLDLHFFCKEFRRQHFDGASSSLETSCMKKLQMRDEIMDPHLLIDWLQCHIELIEEAIISSRVKQRHKKREGEDPHLAFHGFLSDLRQRLEAVKLLLDNNETNVNAIDFRGYTPLDLAMESVMETNSKSLKAHENCGAIQKFQEAPLEVARVDYRGRNPLHRLIISGMSDCIFKYPSKSNKDQERSRFLLEGLLLDMENFRATKEEALSILADLLYLYPTGERQGKEQFDLMVEGILLNPENFRELATAKDKKGRTPLHYAVMPTLDDNESSDNIEMLLNISSEVNAADIYGKTPLHYTEDDAEYELLVKHGADEDAKDIFGNKPKDGKEFPDFETIDEDKWPIMELYLPTDIAQVLKTDHVTELTKRKLVETIRIYSQSTRPKESSEEAIWKMWTKNNFIRLNRRLSQLKASVKRFMERLADGIKQRDERFECQPIIVGSSEEETRIDMSVDFDFNFRLIKFSTICEPFPHPLGPNGYFELRKKVNKDKEHRIDEPFDIFFNLDHCLLTDEVNSRFRIILEQVLCDPDLWQKEHQFDWDMKHRYSSRYCHLDGLCTNIRLRLVNPIEDGEGGFLFVKISIDITACVRVDDWWPEDPLLIEISPAVKTDGCTFVFHRPDSRLSKLRGSHLSFSNSFARISFAPLESLFIKESSPLVKAAYVVCKMLLSLYSESGTTYQLKNCLLFCMEALNAIIGNESRFEDNITPEQLAFWVERIMFCFMEFSRHRVFPCYFMPSFRQEVKHSRYDGHIYYLKRESDKKTIFSYRKYHDLYLDLCPDDTAIDIPVEQNKGGSKNRDRDPNNDAFWERFDREDFIRLLSSRRFH